MEALLISFVTFLSTLAGGLFGLRHKDRLHLIISFTAGVLIAVVFFDVIPELFALTAAHEVPVAWGMAAVVGGFLLIHVLEKLAAMHGAHEDEYADHKHPLVGTVGATGLVIHSFLDGVGIGLGFRVSAHVGLVVALAVIAHDFCDGLNSVSVMLLHNHSPRRAAWQLFFTALAPILGALTTLAFAIPEEWLIAYLGLFAGFLLYLGASDLLPEAHSKHSSYKMVALTVLGAALMFAVTRFA